MGKEETKKMEWTWKGIDKSISLVRIKTALEELLPEIRKIPAAGMSGFKGFGKVGWGDGEKDDQLITMAVFSKRVTNADGFTRDVESKVLALVEKTLKGIHKGTKPELINAEGKD